jgi:quinol monooxygenase YgiN
MYTIYVKFTCVPGKREAYVKKLYDEGIVDAVRAEDGCIKYDFYFSEKDETELLLVEAWESAGHQKIHIGQPHMARLRDIKDGYIEKTELREFEIR